MEDPKSKEFQFVDPKYDWDWNITDIVPDYEKLPVLLVRNGEEIESHDFTLPLLIERLGIDEQFFVINPENLDKSHLDKSRMDERRRIYHCKRMYSAQLILKELGDKKFILSDRVFKRKGCPTDACEDPYGFPNMGATITIGTNGYFLSFYWKNQLEVALSQYGVAEIKDYHSLHFHNLKRDLVHQQDGESEGESDPTGQKYLRCLESAIELCKRTKEVPSLALQILHRGVSNTLLGYCWTPAIFRELRYARHSSNRTYGLVGVNISLGTKRIQAVKEAYSRLSAVDSILKEMIKDRRTEN